MFHGLKYDPIPALLKSDNEAIKTFVLHDLLGKKVSFKALWQLPAPQKILKNQKTNGSWSYPSKKIIAKKENYDQ